jgi:ketol-acid reductoisomerase
MSSQYGQLKGSMELDTSQMRQEFNRVAKDRILSGDFAKEFMALDHAGPGVQTKLDELYQKVGETELAKGEDRVRERLGLPA